MSKNNLFLLALGASFAASLCFVAGTESFGIVAENVGNFAGIVVGAVAALLWIAYGRAGTPD